MNKQRLTRQHVNTVFINFNGEEASLFNRIKTGFFVAGGILFLTGLLSVAATLTRGV